MNKDIANEEKSATIKLLDEQGNVLEQNILFTFECAELNKNYIVFETGKIDEEGKEIIGVTEYDPNSSVVEIKPITDPDELEMVNETFNMVLESRGA